MADDLIDDEQDDPLKRLLSPFAPQPVTVATPQPSAATMTLPMSEREPGASLPLSQGNGIGLNVGANQPAQPVAPRTRLDSGLTLPGAGTPATASPNVGAPTSSQPAQKQDLEPHGWRKALGLGLAALAGATAPKGEGAEVSGRIADQFLHGAEQRQQQKEEEEAKLGQQNAATAASNAETQLRLHPPAPAAKVAFHFPDDQGQEVAVYEDGTTKVVGTGQPAKPEDVKAMYAGAVSDAQKRGVDPNTDPAVKQLAAASQALDKPAAEKTQTLEQQYDEAVKANDTPRQKQILNEMRQTSGAKKIDPDTKVSATERSQVERESRGEIRKADADYRTAKAAADMQREFIKEAKGGNKEAVRIVPLEGALEITTSQGVHRINRTEVAQYGEGVGSLYDRIAGAIGKGVSGKNIPDNILDDMGKLTDAVSKNAYQKYKDTYEDNKSIAEGAGVTDFEKKLPRIEREAETQVHNGFEYTKGDDGQWHKGKRAQ